MHKKTKIFIILFFILSLFFQNSFAKYVIEDLNVVAKVNIDCTKPTIELIDIISSNIEYLTYANQTHLITGHIKLIESNIIRNELSTKNIKIAVGNRYTNSENDIISVEFKSFSLISENNNEKIYEFSFTYVTGNGALAIIIPEGIVEDKSRFG